MHTYKRDLHIEIFLRIPLSNLTFLCLSDYSQLFDEFEKFISKIQWKFKVLRLTTLSEDIGYLDANRWKALILKY